MGRDTAMRLFEDYMAMTGVASLSFEKTEGELAFLEGKKLGIVNGSSWITLWSTFFGRMILPGVKLVNVGNEAQQLNFMGAHARGEECPPLANIQKTCCYARDLCELYRPDAILLTCSTMNRAYTHVEKALEGYDVPLVQIDAPMMERAVQTPGNILIVATHGPTVNSTRALLEETAQKFGRKGELHFCGTTVEEAFERLGAGDVRGHNRIIAQAIQKAQQQTKIHCVVLAQLSMSVFCIEHPQAEKEFGVPVLCSGVEGFCRVREIFRQQAQQARRTQNKGG